MSGECGNLRRTMLPRPWPHFVFLLCASKLFSSGWARVGGGNGNLRILDEGEDSESAQSPTCLVHDRHRSRLGKRGPLTPFGRPQKGRGQIELLSLLERLFRNQEGRFWPPFRKRQRLT